MAREFGPKGIHVAYFMIDAAIDTPRTRPILAADKPDDFFAKPAAIAEEMFRVAHQDRSTWSLSNCARSARLGSDNRTGESGGSNDQTGSRRRGASPARFP